MSNTCIKKIKILNICVVILFFLILSSCNKVERPPVVVPPAIGSDNMQTVYYTYKTYEEMLEAGDKCMRKTYSYFFDLQFEGVKEYSYCIRGLKSGGKKSEDEEIDSNVYCSEYIITGRFDEEKEFSLYFYISHDKENVEEALKNAFNYEWESNPLYDEYEDYARYYLKIKKYSPYYAPYLTDVSFTGPFEDELIQQVLDYIYASILSQGIE